LSWDQINVRPDELNMNPDILPRAVIRTELRAKEMQTELAIPESFCPEELCKIGDHGSDSVADFCGVRKGMLAPNEHNMPSEYSEWHNLKFGVVGEHKTPKLKFMFKGAPFWLPKQNQDFILANVFGKEDRVLCEFRWSAGAMGFRISERSDTSATMASESTSGMIPAEQPAVKPPICMGKRISAKDLPASSVGHEIMDAVWMPIKGKSESCILDTAEGLFTLPASFSRWIFAEAERRNNPHDLSFLRGCKVVKPAGGTMVRVSPGGTFPNAEPLMWIITAAGRDLVRQTETTGSAKKSKEAAEKAADAARKEAAEATEAAAKKRAREPEAEAAESSQVDGGEPSNKLQKT
jgi:hypothetical protein